MDLAVDISTGLPHDHEEVVHIEGPGPVVDFVEEVLDLDVSWVLPGSSHGVLKGLNNTRGILDVSYYDFCIYAVWNRSTFVPIIILEGLPVISTLLSLSAGHLCNTQTRQAVSVSGVKEN